MAWCPLAWIVGCSSPSMPNVPSAHRWNEAYVLRARQASIAVWLPAWSSAKLKSAYVQVRKDRGRGVSDERSRQRGRETHLAASNEERIRSSCQVPSRPRNQTPPRKDPSGRTLLPCRCPPGRAFRCQIEVREAGGKARRTDRVGPVVLRPGRRHRCLSQCRGRTSVSIVVVGWRKGRGTNRQSCLSRTMGSLPLTGPRRPASQQENDFSTMLSETGTRARTDDGPAPVWLSSIVTARGQLSLVRCDQQSVERQEQSAPVPRHGLGNVFSLSYPKSNGKWGRAERG